MKYEIIKGVAHDFGHSFVSLTNFMADEYVMDHLLHAAAASGQPELRVDLLTGAAQPAVLVVPLVKASLEIHCAWLPGKLREQGVSSPMREATMRVHFDLSALAPPASGRVMAPVVCEVEITDNRGIIHEASVRHQWPMEIGKRVAGGG
jgi:hypothetical protein